MTPHIYQALSLAAGLRLYDKSRMLPNRAWTPSNMLKTAARITGQPFKRGEYLKAADALQAWAKASALTEKKADLERPIETVS